MLTAMVKTRYTCTAKSLLVEICTVFDKHLKVNFMYCTESLCVYCKDFLSSFHNCIFKEMCYLIKNIPLLGADRRTFLG